MFNLCNFSFSFSNGFFTLSLTQNNSTGFKILMQQIFGLTLTEKQKKKFLSYWESQLKEWKNIVKVWRNK